MLVGGINQARLWHNHGACSIDGDMARAPSSAHGTSRAAARRQRPVVPLDQPALRDLALSYVARYATTRAKLERYLARKTTERGWADPDMSSDAARADIAQRMADLGYVDDAAFARMRGEALTRRGLGARRLSLQLAVDGIGADDAAPVIDAARDAALDAALAFARRRRLGPFAREAVSDPALFQRQLAALLRAGHDASLARRVLRLGPDEQDGAPLREDG